MKTKEYEIKVLLSMLVVVGAIGFAVQWGGIFHRDFDLVKSIVSWTAVWGAIFLYRASAD